MSAKSKGLLYQIKRFEFIFGMFIYDASNAKSYFKTIDYERSLTLYLKNIRNENKEFENIFDQTVAVCKKHKIIVQGVIRRKVSTQIDKQSKSQLFLKINEMK
ncbi:zinc finger MYM-type protein 1-like [Aphis craccivora]|uniref:Zinc finger MYM-type protein 1-like n=1 Tax=Aphis craccivora TaxID=307492 RepID=A0A6G0Y9E6_APHCR|nr:zinc finger MYM-type protein 1-like [Aphis craccivora]